MPVQYPLLENIARLCNEARATARTSSPNTLMPFPTRKLETLKALISSCPYSKEGIVFSKGIVDNSIDPTGMKFRRDIFGQPIARDQYGNTQSKLGWEIDHIDPRSKGGSDDLQNLQPLQWENNRLKSNHRLFG